MTKLLKLTIPGLAAGLATIMCAQTPPSALTLSCPQSSAKPGSQVTVSINYAGTPVAGLEWSLALPWSSMASAGPAASAAQKSINCAGSSTGNTCLLAGLNTLAMSPGVVATYTTTLPTTPGLYVLTLSGTLGAQTNGAALAVAAGSPFSIAVLSRYDLNGDGVINAADLALAEVQALGQSPCTTADFNADGKCDITDVQLLVAASQGLIPQ